MGARDERPLPFKLTIQNSYLKIANIFNVLAGLLRLTRLLSRFGWLPSCVRVSRRVPMAALGSGSRPQSGAF